MTEKFESRPWLLFLAPGLFVLLWSTGFIGAKLGLPFAEPLTFLLVRFACVIGLLGTLALGPAEALAAPPDAMVPHRRCGRVTARRLSFRRVPGHPPRHACRAWWR
jgi:drug/metabolite transporter (DMT)-like permease